MVTRNSTNLSELAQRVVEPHELVEGLDAIRYIKACDYQKTSDYGILAEELYKKFGLLGKQVLEIGSGSGNLCEELMTMGTGLVVGVDAAETMVAHASKKYESLIKEGRMKFVRASVYGMPFSSEFDMVVCQNSFHQLYKPREALQEMVRVAAPEGVVYIADFRRDVSEDSFRRRVQYTKPEIRGDLINSIRASLTKQEFRDMFDSIPDISFSVKDAENPTGLSERVDELIKRDPVPHWLDYLISQRVEIKKFKRRCI
ncbi:MAG: class I SAM-dependent methyltransferase [Candidatus Aenigmarchaeota archaeon]|nr:class I SAM-dependent methyltransferase [Candidatus Aenigmarchaeota archaeon]